MRRSYNGQLWALQIPDETTGQKIANKLLLRLVPKDYKLVGKGLLWLLEHAEEIDWYFDPAKYDTGAT